MGEILGKHALYLRGQSRDIYSGHGKGGHEHLDALRAQQIALLCASKIRIDDIQIHQRYAAPLLPAQFPRDGDGKLGLAAAIVAQQHGKAFAKGPHQ